MVYRALRETAGFAGLEILLVLTLVGVFTGGTVVATDNAKPGDALFGLDLTLERFQERLTNDPVRKTELKVKQLQERQEELEELEDELKTNPSDNTEKNIETAIDLISQGLSLAHETVSSLSQNIKASDQSQSAETLRRVSALLTSLQATTDKSTQTLSRLKTEVDDNETKTRIETVEGSIKQIVRIEEDTDEDTGETEKRVKVYQIDENGIETKILDVRERNGITEMKTNEDDEESDVDQDDSANDNSNEPTISPTSTSAPKPETHRIRWKDDVFQPSSLTISKEDSVEFENTEDDTVQVSSNPHPAHTSLPQLNSANLAKGDKYTFTFNSNGSFGVHNHLSPSQTATITVK